MYFPYSVSHQEQQIIGNKLGEKLHVMRSAYYRIVNFKEDMCILINMGKIMKKFSRLLIHELRNYLLQ